MEEASLNVFGWFKEATGVLIRTKLYVDTHSHSRISINQLALKHIYNIYGWWQRNQSNFWDLQHTSQNSKYLSSYIFLVSFAIWKQNRENK